MRRSSSILIFLLLVFHLLTACYYQKPDYSDEWDLTERRKDSLDFEATHHYTENYNFLMVGDSLSLQTARPYHNPVSSDLVADSVTVFGDDRLVVADIMIVPEDSVDSVWVKVARDQYTMGWVHEKDLLEEVVPDDSISLFIHVFSDKHLIYFLCVLGVLLVVWLTRKMRRKRFHIVHFDDVGSLFPTLLCMTLSGAATLYASMQKFVPDTWMEFYYHPTLNPFGLPFVLGLFVACLLISGGVCSRFAGLPGPGQWLQAAVQMGAVNLGAGMIVIMAVSLFLGCLTLAVIAGISGAGCSSMDDISGASTAATLLIMAGYFVSIMVINLPSAGAQLFVSLCPVLSVFCAPVQYAMGNISFPVLVISWLVQAAVLLWLVRFCAKIYRSLIMYRGNRLTWKDMIGMAEQKPKKGRVRS